MYKIIRYRIYIYNNEIWNKNYRKKFLFVVFVDWVVLFICLFVFVLWLGLSCVDIY